MRTTHTQIKFGAIMTAALVTTGALASRTAHADDAAPVVAAAPADAHHSFVETGRVGVIGALTEDMWKGGLVYEQEHFEVQALIHFAFVSATDREIDTGLKVGGRAALGTLNYFAFGGEFRGHPGAKVGGSSIGRDFQAGPYISLQRYFAATPVMLCLWVNPVLWDHGVDPDASGKSVTTNAIRVLQTGGFGMAYMF